MKMTRDCLKKDIMSECMMCLYPVQRHYKLNTKLWKVKAQQFVLDSSRYLTCSSFHFNQLTEFITTKEHTFLPHVVTFCIFISWKINFIHFSALHLTAVGFQREDSCGSPLKQGARWGWDSDLNSRAWLD